MSSKMLLQPAFRFLIREGWQPHTFADGDHTDGLAPWATALCLPVSVPPAPRLPRLLVLTDDEVAMYSRRRPARNYSWVRVCATRIRWDDGKPGSREKEVRRAMRLLLKGLQ